MKATHDRHGRLKAAALHAGWCEIVTDRYGRGYRIDWDGKVGQYRLTWWWDAPYSAAFVTYHYDNLFDARFHAQRLVHSLETHLGVE